MPDLPEHISGAFSDFSVPDRAAMWGISDDVADMSPGYLGELGFTVSEPQPPSTAGYKADRPLFRVLGSASLEVSRTNDEYYKEKLNEGFFGGNL